MWKTRFSRETCSVVTKIIPIILSGGAGTRLWPVSRRMHPKPFMEVAGKPLLEHALERAALISDEALIVTNQDHYYLTENLIKKIPKAPKVSYLLEPEGRNTAPAIALAVRHNQKLQGDDAVCFVLAADHLISNDVAFEKARALPFARHGARGRRMLEMAGSKMNICVASERHGEAARAHAC